MSLSVVVVSLSVVVVLLSTYIPQCHSHCSTNSKEIICLGYTLLEIDGTCSARVTDLLSQSLTGFCCTNMLGLRVYLSAKVTWMAMVDIVWYLVLSSLLLRPL